MYQECHKPKKWHRWGPPTSTTSTTVAHDNRCDQNHPNEGHDQNGHHNPDCPTTTTTTVPFVPPPHHNTTTTTVARAPRTSTTVVRIIPPISVTAPHNTVATVAATQPAGELAHTGTDILPLVSVALIAAILGAVLIAKAKSGPSL